MTGGGGKGGGKSPRAASPISKQLPSVQSSAQTRPARFLCTFLHIPPTMNHGILLDYRCRRPSSSSFAIYSLAARTQEPALPVPGTFLVRLSHQNKRSQRSSRYDPPATHGLRQYLQSLPPQKSWYSHKPSAKTAKKRLGTCYVLVLGSFAFPGPDVATGRAHRAHSDR